MWPSAASSRSNPAATLERKPATQGVLHHKMRQKQRLTLCFVPIRIVILFLWRSQFGNWCSGGFLIKKMLLLLLYFGG